MQRLQGSAILAIGLCCAAVALGSPAFDYDVPPQGWEVTKGEAALDGGVTASGRHQVQLQSAPIADLPLSATFRVKLAFKQWTRLSVIADGADKPLLDLAFFPHGENSLRYGAYVDGRGMATQQMSSRSYSAYDKPTGSGIYEWRFPRVKNLWDDRDRLEIGASYETLTPFDEKYFVARLEITPDARRIWLDDRLVAEEKMQTVGPIRLSMLLPPGSTVKHVSLSKPDDRGRYIPLHLADYASDGSPRDAGVMKTVGDVPVRVPAEGTFEFNLAENMYRYRLSVGSGPDAGYVNGRVAWPTPMRVDPAVPALRVPYRAYRNVYLLAWVDDDLKHGVPAGTIYFYRDMRGNGARTAFRIDQQAIDDGKVIDTGMKTEAGKTLYLVRVPVNQADFYKLRDLEGGFLDMQITRPVALRRSYPDPIYYGHHPGGYPSSVHVVGVTLEEGDFTFNVEPLKYGHVFERPETPQYKVHVQNVSDKPLAAKVTLETTSYDGSETHSATASVNVPANASAPAAINLDGIERLGWHDLKVRIDAGGHTQSADLSLAILPKDPRSYGFAENEMRIGAWLLLGHYQPFRAGNAEVNTPILEMFQRIGIRRVTPHHMLYDEDVYRRLHFMLKGPHTIVGYYHRMNVEDPEDMKEFLEAEWKLSERQRELHPDKKSIYYFGGEWNYDHHYSYMPLPRYTGGGDYEFGEAAIKNMQRQMKMFYAVADMYRTKMPNQELILQWGAPMNLIGFLEQGFKQEYIDGYGMDAPMFELTPEVAWMTGCINQLWQIRQEIERLDRPQLEFNWCEGPFLPTNEGALTEQEQAENHVRYWLMGLAYGIENFEAGIVPFDAGNYYGAEHYGAGVFHAEPFVSPKPAVVPLVVAANMMNGADVVGPVDTGSLTTYCLAMKHAATGQMRYALWRVAGEVDATLSVSGAGTAVVTGGMGNETSHAINNGQVTVTLSPMPVWVTGVGDINSITLGEPRYQQKPADVVVELPAFTAANWKYDGSADESFASNHFAINRQTDAQMNVAFDQAEEGKPAGAAVTLETQSVDDRPLTARYGSIVPARPAVIPGKATALGMWLKGNSSWGRVVYRVSDAQGEMWTSIGAKDDWNCDDTFTRTYAKHEGWRYVRFPLPGNQPWDQSRELETTWWKHEGGDGIVQLPLKVEMIILETRNAVPYLGEMSVVPDRTFTIAGLVAEYADEADKGNAVIAEHRITMPTPRWRGPTDNPIAEMAKNNDMPAPQIKAFEEPLHFNDGRRMVIRLDEQEGMRYRLYLSRFADGRGADPLRGFYKDKDIVRGLRPGVKMYLFLTAVDANNNESKPSKAYELMTEDKFREK